MRASPGFSLIETVLAAALFAVVALAAFEALRQLSAASTHLAARHAALAEVERVSEALRAEARSAVAIWSASPQAGEGRDGCVELDFAAVDAGGPSFWSYRLFPHHAAGDTVPPDALERVTARGPIVPCDPSLPGRIVLRDLTALAVQSVAPDALAAHADPYLGSPDAPFLAAAVPASAPVALPLLDAGGAPLAGGNRIVEVRVDATGGSRVVDVLPGTFPTGFTEELRYACTERCDVGHDDGGAKTLTQCAVSWQTAWSEYLRWTTPSGASAGAGWFLAGTFSFTYSGTRADGETDTLVRTAPASNWDPARDYGAYPPASTGADGTTAGSFAPWDVRSESGDRWLADLLPYVARGEAAALQQERDRCAAVERAGEAGEFYANG